MRTALTLTFIAIFTSFAAFPQAFLGDDVYVLSGDAAPTIAMTAWQDGGTTRSIPSTEISTVPANATRYSLREAPWPTGRVRVMEFSKETGGVLHPINDETLLYLISGVAEVEVSGKTVKLTKGDVVSRPSGEIRNAGSASDATILTWTVPSLTGEITPTYVRGADVEEGGFGSISIKRYKFPGNSVRAVKLAKGANTNPNSAKTDSLIYVTGGPMTFHQNGRDFVVNAGDFIREVAGLEHFWNVAADSSFVTTSGLPANLSLIDPDKATD